MKRSEVIAAIKKMRRTNVSDEWQEEYQRILSAKKNKRDLLADDFHRAIVYCFIFFTRIGYLNKERRNFLRPTLRSILMAAGLVLFAIVQGFVLIVLLIWIGLEFYAIIIVFFVMMFELGFIVTKGNKLIRGHIGNELGMSYECTKCGYDLSAFDSVLGDKLWVGPEKCPECGVDYPAVV